MAFNLKTWVDRITEYPTRRTLTKENGDSEIVTVTRSEGIISKEGDAFSAVNMNDLEARIKNEFDTQNKNLANVESTLKNYIITVNVESYEVNIPDSESATTDKVVDVPNGYKVLTIIPRSTSNNVWLKCDCYMIGTNYCRFVISSCRDKVSQSLNGKGYAIAFLIQA